METYVSLHPSMMAGFLQHSSQSQLTLSKVPMASEFDQTKICFLVAYTPAHLSELRVKARRES
jgi:hypothetical protein